MVSITILGELSSRATIAICIGISTASTRHWCSCLLGIRSGCARIMSNKYWYVRLSNIRNALARNSHFVSSFVSQPTKRRIPKVNAPPIEITKTGEFNNGNIEIIHPETSGAPPPKLAIDEVLIKDRKSTRLNSSHSGESRMPSSA